MDRLEYGERRDPSRATDVDGDVAQQGRHLFGWVLPRDRPARRLRRRTEPPLQPEVVDLDDDTIDLVLDVVAMLAPVRDVGDDTADVVEDLVATAHRQAERLQRVVG